MVEFSSLCSQIGTVKLLMLQCNGWQLKFIISNFCGMFVLNRIEILYISYFMFYSKSITRDQIQYFEAVEPRLSVTRLFVTPSKYSKMHNYKAIFFVLQTIRNKQKCWNCYKKLNILNEKNQNWNRTMILFLFS